MWVGNYHRLGTSSLVISLIEGIIQSKLSNCCSVIRSNIQNTSPSFEVTMNQDKLPQCMASMMKL